MGQGIQTPVSQYVILIERIWGKLFNRLSEDILLLHDARDLGWAYESYSSR